MMFPRFRRRRPEPPVPAVLVLRALGLGDLLTVAPALRGIARAFTGQPLLVATGRHLAPLAARIVPSVQVLDTTGLHGRLDPGTPVGTAIDLHGSGPESHRLLLGTRPECLVAFRHPTVWDTPDAPVWNTDEHEVIRWARLLDSVGVETSIEDLRIDAPDGTGRDPDLTVIHPGAASSARRWPEERWARVATSEHRAGRRVVLTGTVGERNRACAIARLAGLPEETVRAGETDIESLTRLIAGAGMLFSSDTGPAHLATALGTPSVTLFGPVSPARWGPIIDRDLHATIWHGTEGDTHAPTIDRSLTSIGSSEVLIAAAEVRGETVPIPGSTRNRILPES